MEPNTAPATSEAPSLLTLAQIYKITYDSLLGNLSEGIRGRVLAMVGKDDKSDREVGAFISTVAKVAETTYDQLVANQTKAVPVK